MAFEHDFEKFMRALAAKDLNGFKTFLNKDVFGLAILPPALTFDTLEAFQASQDHWFNGTTGSFTYEIKLVRQENNMALGVVRATYKNIGDDAKPFTKELWISSVFKFQSGQWKLVFVQNTIIS